MESIIGHISVNVTDIGVDAYYAAALSGGGRDNGAPGVRAPDPSGYCGAFELDPDGHNVEAMFHGQV